MKRDYILYVPASYTANEAVPLLLNFHSYTGNASEHMSYADFRPIADTANFIIVHPQGLMYDGSTHWNVGGWITGSPADDVGFVASLIDSLAENYSIDLGRVYATGMSNGGYMSFLLACQLSDKITAIASVTGSMTPETYTHCNPLHPTPILQIHGDQDGIVPFTGASWTHAITDVMDYWINFNQCSTSPLRTTFPNLNPSDGSTAESIVYGNGLQGTQVAHIHVTGGGHSWPRKGTSLPATNADFDASQEIWQFLARYDLDELSNITSIENEQKPLTISPQPAKHIIYIEHSFLKPTPFQLLGLDGKTVVSGKLQANRHALSIAHLPTGIYLLAVGQQFSRVMKVE